MNETIKNLLWAARGVVLATVIILVTLSVTSKPSASIKTGATAYGAGISNYVGAIAIASGNGVTPGFLETPQLSFYSANGDVNQQGARQNIVASSSVDCFFQNPSAVASSSFEFNLNISSSSASAGNVQLFTAATQYATTTAVGAQQAIGANAQFTESTQGTTTNGTGGIIGPNAFLNLGGPAGASAGLLQYGGSCNAVFTIIN